MEEEASGLRQRGKHAPGAEAVTSQSEEAEIVQEDTQENAVNPEGDQQEDAAEEDPEETEEVAAQRRLSKALSFMQAENFAMAVPVLERYLATVPREKRNASCLHNLAVCHNELGNWQKAEEMFWEAASAWERQNDNKIAVYRTMYGLASVMTKQGDAAKLLQGEILLRDVLEVSVPREDMLNDTYRCYVLLGENLVKQKKWSTAAEVWGYTAGMSDRMFGSDHEIVLEHRARLAKAQRMAAWQPYVRAVSWGLCAAIVVLVAAYLYYHRMGWRSVADSGENVTQDSSPVLKDVVS